LTANRDSKLVKLIDVADSVNRTSPHDIAGNEFLFEHVHMNFEGNYLAARAFADGAGCGRGARIMSTSRKLWVESLENRALLAGNVSVSVSDGTLFITGGSAGNGVSVQQLNSGRYYITGFNVSGGNTTVNGSSTTPEGDAALAAHGLRAGRKVAGSTPTVTSRTPR